VLQQYGGEPWAAVQKQAAAGSVAGEQFEIGAAAYRQALELLPAAVSLATTSKETVEREAAMAKAVAEREAAVAKAVAEREAKYQAAIMAAESAMKADDWKKADAQAQVALELQPASAAAKAVLTKIIPFIHVTAELDGKALAGARITINGTLMKEVTPADFPVKRDMEYAVSVTLPDNNKGKVYVPASTTVKCDRSGVFRFNGVIKALGMLVPAGCKVQAGAVPEPYTKSGWAQAVVHDKTGIELVYIPAGSFMMGSPADAANRDNDDVQHRVTLTKGFYLGKYEVTQAQWVKIMGSNPSSFKGDRLPVEQVSWDDSQNFCRQAGFRLPTEAEWEYACRAGSTGAYSGTGVLNEMGWVRENSGSTTHPIGQKQPNAWGLYDMHGNVWEWCADWYGAYSAGDVIDPTGASKGSDHVLRGGSWFNVARLCRSTDRSGFGLGYRISLLGFRVVLPIVQ